MSASTAGTMLGDLAASDMGPLVADRLDAESCRNLALSGVQGRALTRRRSVVKVNIVEGSVTDLAAEARVDAQGNRRARDCYALHVRLPASVMQDEGWLRLKSSFPWTLKIPGSVMECEVAAVSLSHADLARLRDTLPTRASLDACCSVFEEMGTSGSTEPVRVRALTVDWLSRPWQVPEFVAANHLVTLDIGWVDPQNAGMCFMPSLQEFKLTSQTGRTYSASPWLVWCCGLPRLKSIVLSFVKQEGLPDLATNASVTALVMRARHEVDGETTNLRGCISAFTALEKLALSRMNVRDVFRDLHGLRVSYLCLDYIPRKPDMSSCSLPRLRALWLTDEVTNDFHLPSAPVLEMLTVWSVYRRRVIWNCEKLAASSTALPLLTEVILQEGVGGGSGSPPPALEPASCWREMGWTVGPTGAPFHGHCLTRPRPRAA